MIKAIIFDMDGVLVDTEPIWSKGDKELLRRKGVNYNDEFKTEIIGKCQKIGAQFIKINLI